ncbi:MAG: MATE family efflux transporter [Desulfurococcales archaeon]|nr:MATE family efflux transporter [Desulfurococcales archaeon]
MQKQPIGRAEIWRELLRIGLPLMLAESLDSVLWITDTYFVSNLGDVAVEAVGLGGYIGWLTFTVSSIFYMGALVLVSQAAGAGKHEKAEEALAETLSLSLLLGLPVGISMWLFSPLLAGLIAGPRVSGEAVRLAVAYYRARIPGILVSYPAAALASAYRGYGRTKPILWGSMTYTTANILLDPILIFGLLGTPKLGVIGAGVASSIASLVYLLVLLLLLAASLPIRPRLYMPRKYAVTAVKLGVPTFIERLVTVSGHMAYLGVIARCGDESLAAHTIGVRIESLAFLPLYSMSEAAAALTGQEIGRGDYRAAKRKAWLSAELNLLVGVAVGLLLVTLKDTLPGVFTENPYTRQLAGIYLLLAAISEPLFGEAISLTMSIRAAGNTMIPLAINTITYYSVRVTLSPILAAHFPTPYCAAGAWITMILDHGSRAVLASLLLEKYFYRLARRLI